MITKNNRPIITLTTIPTRLVSNYEKDMRYNLTSLLEQEYEDFEIHLNIPFICKKTKEEYVIPTWLTLMKKEHKRLKIYRTDDYGPITKLLPTLKRVKQKNRIIVVVDDDFIYQKDMLSEQVKNQQKFKGCPVGYDGIVPRNKDGSMNMNFGDIRDHYFTANNMDSRVDILQHYRTISYKRKYFDNDFFDFVSRYHSWNDDALVSAYFAMKKIDRWVTHHPKDGKYETLQEYYNHINQAFPLISSTQHESLEGCALFRSDNDSFYSEELTRYINEGYTKISK